MKEKIQEFLKNKFNIALLVIQTLAIISYLISSLGVFFVVLFFNLEGIFFLVWGIKIFKSIKVNNSQKEIIMQLPYSNEERVEMLKKMESTNKNNRFVAIMLILLGIVLFFSVFSLIF